MRSLLAYSPCVILLLAAAQPRSLLAQYQKYEGQPVVNIRFEPAEQPLEGAELFDMLPLKRDQPLRMSVVRASVERLFATGRSAMPPRRRLPRTFWRFPARKSGLPGSFRSWPNTSSLFER